MKHAVATVVLGNIATLALLALASALGFLFLPYLPTFAWAQLVAFSLRGLRDKLKRGQQMSDHRAATRLLLLFGAGLLVLSTFFAVGLASDAVSVAKAATSAASGAHLPPWAAEQLEAAKPKVIEALEPYVDGFEAGDDIFEIRANKLIEVAGLKDSPYEELTRQAVDVANKQLNGAGGFDVSSAKDTLKSTFSGMGEETKEKLKDALMSAAQGFASSSGSALAGLGTLFNAIASSVSSIVGALVFIFSVYAQLQQPTSYITIFQRRVAPDANEQLEILRAVSENLVITPALTAASFAAATFALVQLVRAPCATTAALIAGGAGLIPLVPVEGVVTLPWALLLLACRRYFSAAVFAVAHVLIVYKIGEFFEEQSKMHLLGLPNAIISLSIVLGLERLGPQGLILGPFIVAFAALLVDAVTTKDEKRRMSEAPEPAVAAEPAVEVLEASPHSPTKTNVDFVVAGKKQPRRGSSFFWRKSTTEKESGGPPAAEALAPRSPRRGSSFFWRKTSAKETEGLDK